MDLFQHVEGYFNRFHQICGIHITQGSICDLEKEIYLIQNTTYDFYIINVPNSILIQEFHFLIFDNQIINNDIQTQLQINIGDKIRIITQLSDIDIYILIGEEYRKIFHSNDFTNNLKLLITGYLILCENVENNQILNLLTSKLYNYQTILNWNEINLNSTDNKQFFNQLNSKMQLYTLFLLLTTPQQFQSENEHLALFQQLNQEQFITFYLIQQQKSYQFLQIINNNQLNYLIQSYDEPYAQNIQIPGMYLMQLSILLEICKNNFEEKNVVKSDFKQFLLNLIQHKVIKESAQRFDGKYTNSITEKLNLQMQFFFQQALIKSNDNIFNNLDHCFNCQCKQFNINPTCNLQSKQNEINLTKQQLTKNYEQLINDNILYEIQSFDIVFKFVITTLFQEDEAQHYLHKYFEVHLFKQCVQNDLNQVHAFRKLNSYGIYFIVKKLLKNQSLWSDTQKHNFECYKNLILLQNNTLNQIDFEIMVSIALIKNFSFNFNAKFLNHVSRYLSIKNVFSLIYCLSFLTEFGEKEQQNIIYLAFHSQILHKCQQYNKQLENMRIFVQNSGFCFDNLKYNNNIDTFNIFTTFDNFNYITILHACLHKKLDDLQSVYQIDHTYNSQKEYSYYLQTFNDFMRKLNYEDASNIIDNNQEDLDSEVCPICYQQITSANLVQLTCNHVICDTCILKTSLKCPVCRSKIDKFTYQGFEICECEFDDVQEDEEEYS